MSGSLIIHFTTRHVALKAEDCNQYLENRPQTFANQGIDEPKLFVDNTPAHAGVETLVACKTS